MQATNKGGNFTPAPQPMPATTFARCYSVVDFGTTEQYYNNQPTGKAQKVMITWELPEFTFAFDEKRGPQPYVISKDYKLSTHEKSNLSKLIMAWRGTKLTPEEQEGFNPMIMCGKPCIVSFNLEPKKDYVNQQITEWTTQNSRIVMTSISPVPGQMQQFPLVNPEVRFDFTPMMQSGQFDLNLFATLPKWMRKRIEESDEFKHFVALGQVQPGQEFGQQSAAPVQPQQPPVMAQPTQQPPTQQPPVTQPTQAPPVQQQPPAPGTGNPPAGMSGW